MARGLPRPGGSDQKARPGEDQPQRERQSQSLGTGVVAADRVGRQAENCQHQTGSGCRRGGQRNHQSITQVSAFDGLEVRAKHVDELVGLHERLIWVARSDKALRPRCTDTLMADSDMPDRAAASPTLSPSSLTNWMACRALGVSCSMSVSRSIPLSMEEGSSSATTWSASSIATSLIDVLVRRRKATSL